MVARLLLVHSPLVGRGTWDLVAAGLAQGGDQVGVPDLTGTVAAGPPYCSRQAEVIASSAAGQPAILIAIAGQGRCWPRRVASLKKAAGTSSVRPARPAPGGPGCEPVRPCPPRGCG